LRSLRLIALRSTQKFSNPIAVLVSSDGEKPQQGCHRGKSAAHSSSFFLVSPEFIDFVDYLSRRPHCLRCPFMARGKEAPDDKDDHGSHNSANQPGTFISAIPADCLP